MDSTEEAPRIWREEALCPTTPARLPGAAAIAHLQHLQATARRPSDVRRPSDARRPAHACRPASGCRPPAPIATPDLLAVFRVVDIALYLRAERTLSGNFAGCLEQQAGRRNRYKNARSCLYSKGLAGAGSGGEERQGLGATWYKVGVTGGGPRGVEGEQCCCVYGVTHHFFGMVTEKTWLGLAWAWPCLLIFGMWSGENHGA